MKEDLKVLLSAAAGGTVSLGLAVPSALWMDRVIAPVLRGTDWDWLLLGSVLLIIGGAGYIWYRVTIWTLERLDKIA